MEFGDVSRMERSMGAGAIDKNQTLKVRLLYIADMGLDTHWCSRKLSAT